MNKLQVYCTWNFKVGEEYHLEYDPEIEYFSVFDHNGVERLSMTSKSLMKYFDEKSCKQLMREQKLKRICKDEDC
ncbi:MAG: hypothetical protein M0R46_11720 [Candidatus Muirbacterium halophilum]|nr:hypothetical protein [Candidatus Muirbacterium halophilum]